MELEGKQVTYASRYQYKGEQHVNVSAGQSIKIETSPDGVEVLDMACPAGKKWTAHIFLYIDETDA